MKTAFILAAAALSGLALRASSTRPLAPLPTPPPGVAAPAPPSDPDHFVFAVGGDNRAVGRYLPMPPTARQIFAELRLLQPALCLWTGDTIYGSEESLDEADGEYDRFLADAGRAETALFNAVGNHEIHDLPERERLYERRMGRLYGSFDYGNTHFVAIDTEEAGRKVGVGPEQEAWLKQDLEANQGAANIVVFSHHPLFPKETEKADAGFADPANRDEIHRLFASHHVKYVFSGHEHLFARSSRDGVEYVVTGGAGAPSEGSPEKGGFQHYLLAYVDGGKISLVVLQPWRLFAEVGPVQPNGSCQAVVENYEKIDLSVSVEFPSAGPASAFRAFAAFASKTGGPHPVGSEIVPSRRPGVVTVRVTAPGAKAVDVSIAPAPKGAGP